jgi:hypothetical protein
MPSLEDVLAGIYAVDGKDPVGAGFLVDQDLVITCAHVVNKALGREMLSTGRPTGTVRVRFVGRTRDVAGWIDPGDYGWSDPPAERQSGADLCLLRLEAGSSNELSPAKLREFVHPVHREFRAAGFPAGWHVDFAKGEVAGRGGGGLYLLRPSPEVLAIVSTGVRSSLVSGEQRPAGIIHAGFSGGPVEIEGTIAGLLSSARQSVSEATAYMILVSAFPQHIRTLAQTAPNEVAEAFPHVGKLVHQILQKKQGDFARPFDLRLRLCTSFSDVLEAHRTRTQSGRGVNEQPREYVDGVDLRPIELARMLYVARDKSGGSLTSLLLHAPGGAGKSSFLFQLLLCAPDEGLVPYYLDFSNILSGAKGEDVGKGKQLLQGWFDVYNACGDAEDLLRLAKNSPGGMRPLLVIDGFNQARRDWGNVLGIIAGLSNRELAGAAIIVADRMVERGTAIAEFRRAVIPPLSARAYKAALSGTSRETIAGETQWIPILSAPLFLGLVLQSPEETAAVASRFRVLNQYFRKVCGFEIDEMRALTEFAFASYKEFGQTAIPSYRYGPDFPGREKVDKYGIIHNLAGDFVEFRHQILQDYLAALKVASTTEELDETLLRSPAFDVLSLDSASADAIELAVEALQFPNELLARRQVALQPGTFLTEVYDWNYWITFQCVSSLDRRGNSPLQPWLRHAFYALNQERLFDPFLHTAFRAQRLRSEIPVDVAYLRSTSLKELVAEIRVLLADASALYAPGSTTKDEADCREWGGLYLEWQPQSRDDLGYLWRDPLLSWTAANVIRRSGCSAALVRELILLYEISKATSDSVSKPAGFRWRIVHALGRSVRGARDFLLNVAFDAGETSHVRYGAVRSLVEFAATQAEEGESVETLRAMEERLAELFTRGDVAKIANVRREVRRVCAFNEPHVVGRDAWQTDWTRNGLPLYLKILRMGERFAIEKGLSGEAESWKAWKDAIEKAAQASDWDARKSIWLEVIRQERQ